MSRKRIILMTTGRIDDGAGIVDWAGLGLAPIGRFTEDGRIWHRLALRDRKPVRVDADGNTVAVDREEIGRALYQALEETCEGLWGHSWPSAVGEIFRMNRRTTQRDRVSRNLLPARVLQMIAFVAEAEDRIELAGALLAMARYAARFPDPEMARSYWAAVPEILYGDYDAAMGVVEERASGEEQGAA